MLKGREATWAQLCESVTRSGTLGGGGYRMGLHLAGQEDTERDSSRALTGPPWLSGIRGEYIESGGHSLRLQLVLDICRGGARGSRLEHRRDPTQLVRAGLQIRRMQVTHTAAWQHSCLKIERMKVGWVV